MIADILNVFRSYLTEPVLDIFYPPVCFFCNHSLPAERKIICTDCWLSMRRVPSGAEEELLSGLSGSSIDRIFVMYDFDEQIQQLIHLLKYEMHFTIAKYFASDLWQHICSKSHPEYHAVIPVPLHPAKYREREYNQSQILADELGLLSGIKSNDVYLKRVINTPSQTKLNRQQRMENVCEAFAVCKNSSEISGRSFLVIDDVITTGSTLAACASILKNSDAAHVHVAAIATPLLHSDRTEHQTEISKIFL